MDSTTIFVLGLMAVAVLLFVSDRLRSDMVAMIIVVRAIIAVGRIEISTAKAAVARIVAMVIDRLNR